MATAHHKQSIIDINTSSQNNIYQLQICITLQGKRLTKTQLFVVAIAASAIFYLGIFIGEPPWISLYLAFSFGLYGLVRKQLDVRPLIGFNYAAKQLPLTLLGFLQYIAPTISFLIAVYFYGEVFTFCHKVAFFGIWSALLIISASPFRRLVKIKPVST